MEVSLPPKPARLVSTEGATWMGCCVTGGLERRVRQMRSDDPIALSIVMGNGWCETDLAMQCGRPGLACEHPHWL